MSVQRGFRIVCNGCGESGPWTPLKARESHALFFEDAEDDLFRLGWMPIDRGIHCPLCVRIAERGLRLAVNEKEICQGGES